MGAVGHLRQSSQRVNVEGRCWKMGVQDRVMIRWKLTKQERCFGLGRRRCLLRRERRQEQQLYRRHVGMVGYRR